MIGAVEIIPSLLRKQKELEKTQFSRVIEGFRGLRSLFHELFSQKEKEILVFGLNELLRETSFISFFRYYHDLRKQKKIKLKLILNKEMKQLTNKILAFIGWTTSTNFLSSLTLAMELAQKHKQHGQQ